MLRAPRPRVRSAAAVLQRADIRSTGSFDLITWRAAPSASIAARACSEDPAESLIVMLQHEGECTPAGRREPSAGPAPGVPRQPPAVFAALSGALPPDRDQGGRWRARAAARVAERLHRPTVEPRSRPGRLAGIAIDELGREERDNVAQPLANIAFDLLGLALSKAGRSAATPARMAEMRVHWAKAQMLVAARPDALAGESSREARASRCACCSACSPPKATACPTASSSSACCAVTTPAGPGAGGPHHHRHRAVLGLRRRRPLRARFPPPLRAVAERGAPPGVARLSAAAGARAAVFARGRVEVRFGPAARGVPSFNGPARVARTARHPPAGLGSMR